MSKSCTICADPRSDEFDRRARLEGNIAKIAQDFALSYDAFYRHIKANHHIREVTAMPTNTELATAGDILKEITEHHKEAVRLKNLAETDGDLKTALLGLDKALKCLELIAKIQGQIQTQQQINIQNNTQVNILQAPEWIALRTILLEVLRRYPDALEAVTNVLP